MHLCHNIARHGSIGQSHSYVTGPLMPGAARSPSHRGAHVFGFIFRFSSTRSSPSPEMSLDKSFGGRFVIYHGGSTTSWISYWRTGMRRISALIPYTRHCTPFPKSTTVSKRASSMGSELRSR